LFWHVIDMEEELLRQTLQAGRIQEAFDIYWHRMGSWDYLGRMLGSYTRGAEILRGFVGDDPAGVPEELARADQQRFVNARGLFLMSLGQLEDARACFVRSNELARRDRKNLTAARALCHTAQIMLYLGRLREALSVAEESQSLAAREFKGNRYRISLMWKSYVNGLLGNIDEALSGFDEYWQLRNSKFGEEGGIPQMASLREAFVLTRIGQLERAAELVDECRRECEQSNEVLYLHRCYLGLAEIARLRNDLERAGNLSEQALKWAMDTAHQEMLSWAYLLRARQAFDAGEYQTSCLAVRQGLRIVEEHGYGLHWIDLKVLEGEQYLDKKESTLAEDCARVALAGRKQEVGPDLLGAQDLASGYAWGQADALHLLGQALLVQQRLDEARQALGQAASIRQRIRDPRAKHSRDLCQSIQKQRKRLGNQA
jgi:tetratricopeptide (TPR) repeat protein